MKPSVFGNVVNLNIIYLKLEMECEECVCVYFLECREYGYHDKFLFSFTYQLDNVIVFIISFLMRYSRRFRELTEGDWCVFRLIEL